VSDNNNVRRCIDTGCVVTNCVLVHVRMCVYVSDCQGSWGVFLFKICAYE
jgi:hypothetical protein